ncbi:helix-turn-helix transcriptional regulator [Verrucosispora sp. NA02020]|uniref:helix-turn-helix transcriptional regulator n=1 Tax=Verrucosispora sp. NA02020 TaxID=2742132 RepID=UPI003D75A059
MTTHRRTRTRQPSDSGDGGPVWNAEAILALGVSTDLATAAQIFKISLSTAYRLVKRDEFPVPVVRAGIHYRVPVTPILTILGLSPAISNTTTETATPSPPTTGTRPSGDDTD